jgi:hypothetical protein
LPGQLQAEIHILVWSHIVAWVNKDIQIYTTQPYNNSDQDLMMTVSLTKSLENNVTKIKQQSIHPSHKIDRHHITKGVVKLE